MTFPTWSTLDPDDCRELTADFTAELEPEGDTVASWNIAATIGVNVADGVASFVGKAGTTTPPAAARVLADRAVQFWVYGCSAGRHVVEITIQSAQGRTLSRSGYLRVHDR